MRFGFSVHIPPGVCLNTTKSIEKRNGKNYKCHNAYCIALYNYHFCYIGQDIRIYLLFGELQVLICVCININGARIR